jgi:hypothetical protein
MYGAQSEMSSPSLMTKSNAIWAIVQGGLHACAGLAACQRQCQRLASAMDDNTFSLCIARAFVYDFSVSGFYCSNGSAHSHHTARDRLHNTWWMARQLRECSKKIAFICSVNCVYAMHTWMFGLYLGPVLSV